jgi:hypothetical protein
LHDLTKGCILVSESADPHPDQETTMPKRDDYAVPAKMQTGLTPLSSSPAPFAGRT